MRSRRAFTLVELLVVIGIIAVLVAILLPALGGARRSAESVKCAAALREIGNAFRLYAIDSKGWYPPSQLQPGGGKTYSVDDFPYPDSSNLGAYWFTFLAKYATKSKLGNTSIGGDAAEARKSIFWGCPTWIGYHQSSIADINRNQIGYGMSYWPTFNPGYPRFANTFPPASERSFITSWGVAAQQGNFIKEKTWLRNGTARILVADSRFWSVDSQPPPANGQFPPQSVLQNTIDYTGPNQTYIHVYRHGKFPPRHGTNPNAHATTGGKVAYNLLWADGHVTSENDQKNAYLGVRFRFPG